MSTRVPISCSLLFKTVGMPKGFFNSKHSRISCLYLGSNIWRWSFSIGYITILSGNKGIKFVILPFYIGFEMKARFDPIFIMRFKNFEKMLPFETGSRRLYVYASSIWKLFFFKRYLMLPRAGSKRWSGVLDGSFQPF